MKIDITKEEALFIKIAINLKESVIIFDEDDARFKKIYGVSKNVFINRLIKLNKKIMPIITKND
jgi:hypothetical protein